MKIILATIFYLKSIGLLEKDNEPEIVTGIVGGTSKGSLMGAFYVSDNLGQLDKWVYSLIRFIFYPESL